MLVPLALIVALWSPRALAQIEITWSQSIV